MKTTASKTFFMLSVFGFLMICGCSTANTKICCLSKTDKIAIETVVNEYVIATLSDDCLVLASLFAEDGIQIPPDVPPHHSRKAIRDWCDEEDIEISDLVMPIDDIEGCRDIAWVRGSYQFQFMDLVKGNYVMTLKRQPDDLWQINILIWTNQSK